MQRYLLTTQATNFSQTIEADGFTVHNDTVSFYVTKDKKSVNGSSHEEHDIIAFFSGVLSVRVDTRTP